VLEVVEAEELVVVEKLLLVVVLCVEVVELSVLLDDTVLDVLLYVLVVVV